MANSAGISKQNMAKLAVDKEKNDDNNGEAGNVKY